MLVWWALVLLTYGLPRLMRTKDVIWIREVSLSPS